MNKGQEMGRQATLRVYNELPPHGIRERVVSY